MAQKNGTHTRKQIFDRQVIGSTCKEIFVGIFVKNGAQWHAHGVKFGFDAIKDMAAYKNVPLEIWKPILQNFFNTFDSKAKQCRVALGAR